MDKAIATQLANIEKRTGRSLDELTKLVRTSGLQKHGEIRDYLKCELDMGHGDANTLVHVVLKSDGTRAAEAAGLRIRWKSIVNSSTSFETPTRRLGSYAARALAANNRCRLPVGRKPSVSSCCSENSDGWTFGNLNRVPVC